LCARKRVPWNDSTRTLMTYRPDIDGLRSIAVLMVLIFHFGLTGSYGAGFLGVDLFFVISGFLITSIITKEIELGRFSLSDFYVKRIRRLAPALSVTLALSIVFGTLWLFPRDLIALAKQIVAAQLYISNIYYWRTLSYFGLTANSAYFLHTWSLAVEEQFYLIYPIAAAFILKHFRSHFWMIISIVMLISFALNVSFVARKPDATFYLLPTRAWELLAGALMVRACQQKRWLQDWKNTLTFTGAVAIGASFLILNTSYRFPGMAALAPTVGAMLLIGAGSGAQSVASKYLSLRPLVYTGRISYPLYLVHWPILTFAEYHFSSHPGLPVRLALFAASFILAAGIYHLVELPIRRQRRLPGNVALSTAYAGFLGISLAACLFAGVTNGLTWRYPERVLALASYANDKTEDMPQCEFVARSQKKQLCTIGDSTIKPTWLIYGDSHAWATYHAFDAWLRTTNQSGYFVFMHSCAPVRGAHMYHDNEQCFDFNEQMFAFLAREPDVKNVFLVSIWRQAIDGLSGSSDMVTTPDTSKDIFEHQFPVMIRSLKDIGKSVYIWEPLPCAKESVPNAMAQAELNGSGLTDIQVSESEYLRTFDFFFRTLSASEVDGRLRSSKLLCVSGLCDIQENGVPLYFDNNHPTKSSSDFWKRALLAMRLRDQHAH
jgi:peptidoglycan/LPS O-acetylase OafA/YrhL